MSRVGKQPVPIPPQVTVTLDGPTVTVTGPKGALVRTFHPAVTIAMDNGAVVVTRSFDTNFYRALHGMTRAIIKNMVIGVTEGYVKQLEMIGVGYRGELKGKRSLMMYVGYSHPVLLTAPEGVTIQLEPKGNLITVSGTDKELVGLTADKIRSVRPPEPYKGKGIRYKGEHVRRKAGKTAA